MIITRLKTKNQVTLPKVIVDQLALRLNELLQVSVERNCIMLVPVEVTPKYSPEELHSAEKIVLREKSRAKTVKAGKEFSKYIRTIK